MYVWSVQSITRSTSNQHSDHCYPQYKDPHSRGTKDNSSTLANLKAQESEVHKLALVLGPKKNTIIPEAWLTHSAVPYQAHLERISDFLTAGPGKWWKCTEEGIEFLDSPSCASIEHKMHHYRSSTLADIELYLH